jgi:tetratricopeptide (TPR) repeat protein
MAEVWALRGHGIAMQWVVFASLVSGCLFVSADDRKLRNDVNRGDIALTFERLEEAESAYRAALQTRPDSPAARRGLSRTLAARGEFEAALVSYQLLGEASHDAFEAIRVAEYCPLLLRAAQASLIEGETERALDRVRTSRSSGCESAGHADLLASVRFAEAERLRGIDRAAAIDLYRASFEADSTRVDAYRRAAQLLVEVPDRDEALRVLSAALEHHPDDAELRQLLFEVLTGTLGKGSIREFRQ